MTTHEAIQQPKDAIRDTLNSLDTLLPEQRIVVLGGLLDEFNPRFNEDIKNLLKSDPYNLPILLQLWDYNGVKYDNTKIIETLMRVFGIENDQALLVIFYLAKRGGLTISDTFVIKPAK